MSNWQNFKKATEEGDNKPPFRTIDGTFLCHECRALVTEADYFATDSVLRWKCSNDHVSFLENFQVEF